MDCPEDATDMHVRVHLTAVAVVRLAVDLPGFYNIVELCVQRILPEVSLSRALSSSPLPTTPPHSVLAEIRDLTKSTQSTARGDSLPRPPGLVVATARLDTTIELLQAILGGGPRQGQGPKSAVLASHVMHVLSVLLPLPLSSYNQHKEGGFATASDLAVLAFLDRYPMALRLLKLIVRDVAQAPRVAFLLKRVFLSLLLFWRSASLTDRDTAILQVNHRPYFKPLPKIAITPFHLLARLPSMAKPEMHHHF
jgi:hypothetical protein